MRNELVPHIYVVIEHQKGYFNCRGTPPQEGRKALASYGGLQLNDSVPGRGRNSGQPSETEGSWKSRYLLKGPTHKLTCSQALTLGSGGERATKKVPET